MNICIINCVHRIIRKLIPLYKYIMSHVILFYFFIKSCVNTIYNEHKRPFYAMRRNCFIIENMGNVQR